MTKLRKRKELFAKMLNNLLHTNHFNVSEAGQKGWKLISWGQFETGEKERLANIQDLLILRQKRT